MRADRSLALWTMPISSPEACSPVSRGAVEPNAHLCSYELSAHTSILNKSEAGGSDAVHVTQERFNHPPMNK